MKSKAKPCENYESVRRGTAEGGYEIIEVERDLHDGEYLCLNCKGTLNDHKTTIETTAK